MHGAEIMNIWTPYASCRKIEWMKDWKQNVRGTVLKFVDKYYMNDFERVQKNVKIDHNSGCEGVTEPKNKVLQETPTTLRLDRNQRGGEIKIH